MTPRVLLIDDSNLTHLQVRAELESAGWVYLGSNEGASGIQRAMEWRPDLILLDIAMPGMNGFEVCSILKARELTAGIPVLFLSAIDDPEEHERAMNLGAVGFVTKPIDGPLLCRRILEALNCTQKQGSERAA